jgi:RNA polymerase sigma-70 factor, ECF subfamily
MGSSRRFLGSNKATSLDNVDTSRATRNAQTRLPAQGPHTVMHPSPHDLSRLLALVATQDRNAFAQLYDATSAKLYGIVLRILNRRDLADEVLQEIFVKIWKRASEFDPARASPITWMAIIARNAALDEVRKRSPISIETTPEALHVASPEASPLQNTELSQDVARLMACLSSLDPQRRDIVVQAYIEGSSREELSQRFGHPVATIKTWLHRSLAQLKACLQP